MYIIISSRKKRDPSFLPFRFRLCFTPFYFFSLTFETSHDSASTTTTYTLPNEHTNTLQSHRPLQAGTHPFLPWRRLRSRSFYLTHALNRSEISPTTTGGILCSLTKPAQTQHAFPNSPSTRLFSTHTTCQTGISFSPSLAFFQERRLNPKGTYVMVVNGT